MPKLVGLHYVKGLYLNMVLYTIRIYPAIQDTTTIVTEFEKFGYNCLPMGMCAAGDILQAKVDELLGDIKIVKTYIGDIIVLRKGCFTKHIDQLRIVFGRLRTEGLKVNAHK